MSNILRALLLSLCFISAAVYAAIDLSYLSESDLNSLASVFKEALSSQELANAHYGAAGLKELDPRAPIPNAQALCELAKTKANVNEVESIYHATSLADALGSTCKYTSPEAVKTLLAAIVPDSTTQVLYFASKSLEKLGQKVDKSALKSSLDSAVKKDDSASSLGYAYHVALALEGDLTSYFDRIEDTIAQADEVDSKYLQFEGGLSVTAITIHGLYLLSERVNKVPAVKADEAVKLANYLISRKGARLPRQAYLLFASLKLLTKNKYHIPVSVSLASNVAVSTSEPNVVTRVCNVLGESVGGVTVTIDSATHVPTSGVVLSKKQMAPTPADKTSTLYQLNFLDQKREKGFYRLSVSVASQDKRLIGTNNQRIELKIMTEIVVADVELAVSDREQATTSNVLKPVHPKKLQNVVQADFHQKLVMKFTVKDQNTNLPIRVHQAFVIFAHLTTGREIVFVAESDKNNNYKFDVDILKSGKEFDRFSGKYSMNLVVGDAVIKNPIMWNVAEVSLKFDGEESSVKVGKEAQYKPQPQIQHLFREPEKRPPRVLSDAFTGLVLVPVVVLLFLWFKTGANISNFSFDLVTLGFHLGLAGILGLYGVFWWQLNMFTTLKYLSPLALVTFLAGNRMLKNQFDSRNAKKDN